MSVGEKNRCVAGCWVWGERKSEGDIDIMTAL